MKELKCPKCGSVFSVDEADYAFILSQVKNQEFEAELRRRMTEIDSRHKAEQQLASAKKEAEIAQLRSRLEAIAAQKESEKNLALAA